MTQYGMQRQRHGPIKNLVEGVGGFIVGVALVILTGNLLKKRSRPKQQPTEAALTGAPTNEAEGQA